MPPRGSDDLRCLAEHHCRPWQRWSAYWIFDFSLSMASDASFPMTFQDSNRLQLRSWKHGRVSRQEPCPRTRILQRNSNSRGAAIQFEFPSFFVSTLSPTSSNKSNNSRAKRGLWRWRRSCLRRCLRYIECRCCWAQSRRAFSIV